MLSHYYLALEDAEATGWMLVALPKERWDKFESIPASKFSREVRAIVMGMDLSRYRKSVRGPKKKPPKRTNNHDSVHVSTKRILDERKKK